MQYSTIYEVIQCTIKSTCYTFYLLNLLNIFHHISSNIVHSQIQVTLCSTYLLNDKDFNTILIYVSIGYDIDKQILVFNIISSSTFREKILYYYLVLLSSIIKNLYYYILLLRSLLLRVINGAIWDDLDQNFQFFNH